MIDRAASFWTRWPPNRLLVEASLWSADPRRLLADVSRASRHVDLLHVDLCDGELVTEPVVSPELVADVRRHAGVPLHVHVMAVDPQPLIAPLAHAGADLITVHVEARDVPGALRLIHDLGKAAGLALCLETDPEASVPYLGAVDALVMITTPLGTKGTPMNPVAPRRLTAMRRLVDSSPASRAVRIVVDGGIRRDTVPRLAAAGADALVAGSLFFASDDPATLVSWLRRQSRSQPALASGGRAR